jgi:hypothetical protein
LRPRCPISGRAGQREPGGPNGRRHDVDFEDAEITIENRFGAKTVFVGALDDLVPSNKRRFARLNVARELFTKVGEGARRAPCRHPATLEGRR